MNGIILSKANVKSINLKKDDTNKKTLFEGFAKVVFFIATGTSVVALAFIMYFILSMAIPKIMEVGFVNFIFGKEWRPTFDPPVYGILPMIVGSIYATLGAIVIGVPFGVSVSMYIAFYAPKKHYFLLKSGINLLASIPSVVYGLFALTVVVPLIRNYLGGAGLSLLAAIIVLSFMILPTVITLSESALRAVPKVHYQGAIGLGASKERSLWTVVLPAAKSGIFSSIILGVGRAIGETMAVAMVAGNQPLIPESLLDGMRTMTINIVLEMKYAGLEHTRALVATGAVLFVFILLINLMFNYVKRIGETN